MRFLMGIVQALVVPGSRSTRSISPTSSSQVSFSGQSGASSVRFNHSGAHPEYQRSRERHSLSGFKTTLVSAIENGAGSVEVSARPALPNTRSTSGIVLSSRSCTCSQRSASVTEMPGSVVGM